ncbi:uncharacterized protein [Aquarana catesbeiana]|uniref:uncharacterized protein isoform X2 n=1 Tax=Aquarana catesbeiana TaxID=8400 RepID=UPI003CC99DD5
MDSGLCKGLLEGLAQTEKTFQETMRRIYEKYDHAFEEDIIVNIVDFTYSAPDGPLPWDFEPKTTRERKHEKEKTPEREQNRTFIQSVIDSSSESLEDLNTARFLPKETSDDIFSRTFIIEEVSENKDSDPTWLEHYKPSYATGNLSPSITFSAGNKETSLPDGHTQTLMPYTGSNIGNKTFYVSPLHCSVPMQIKSFVRRQNKDCSFEDTREFSYIDYQADESRLQHCRETAYCDSGNSSLAHYYPDMVECIRRLWEMPWKKRAADNIVQYYKRHVWNAKKLLSTQQRYYRPFNSRRMRFHSHRECETIKGCFRYKNAVCHSKHFKKSDFMESVHSPGNETFTINSNKDRGSIILDNCFTKQNKVDTHEIGFCMKEQKGQLSVSNCSPVRRNICSRFPLVQSPKKACSIDDRTIILDKTFTCQNKMETDDANSSIYRSNISKLSEVTDVLSESLFSAFPVLQSPRKNIVTLGSSMESKATTPCKSFIKQNQVESYMADSFYIKEQNKQAFMYRKRPETHDVNSSFQNNIKRISQVAGTPPRASPGKHNVMLKCGTDLNNTSLDNTFTYQNAVEVKSYFKEQDKHPLQTSAIRKTFFSALPLIHSPNINTKSFSSLNNTIVNLNKTINYQEGLKTEVAASCNRELTRPFLKLDNPLRRRNLFSNLPVADDLREKKIPNMMFEDIYKIENLNGSHPNVRVQSSDMVWSLVNSPGSRRSKRRANSNLLFSTFKRQKSADETFIKSITNTDSLPKPSPKFSAWS